MTTYFTWPDRGLRYDCRGCGACCKGLGIGLDAIGGQLVALVARRPELAAFVRKRGDAVTAFNPRDRCWFLADDGLCRVEVEDGRAAKPASCRLFPFNRVFRAGSYTIVDFNSVICPLQLAPDRDGAAHADVLAEIATIQDPAIIGTSLPADDALFASEQAIADAIFAGADLDSAFAAQGGGERTMAGFGELAGIAWSAPEPATLAAALQLTPSLRFNELFGPRKYARSAVARMWLAWLGFAALGERLARRALGMQELTTIWSEQAAVMHAIARWDEPAVLAPGRIELPGDPLVRALAQACIDNRKPRRPLGELVTRAFAGAEPSAKVAAIKLAESVVRDAFKT